MKIVITGATGFVGTNLVPKLLENGHELAVLKRKNSSYKELCNSDKFRVFDSDSYEEISFCMKEFKPELVIHLATLYINQHAETDIENLIESNILFGTLLLEAMASNGVGKIINFGTRWQHVDNMPYNPANLYAATKQAFFAILEFYRKKGIRSKTLELCDTFGKHDSRRKIVDLLVDSAKNRNELKLSPGEQILDILFVDDLIAYLEENITDEAFFDGDIISISGTEISLRALGDMIGAMFDYSDGFFWGAKEYRSNEVMFPPCFYKKIGIARNDLRKTLQVNYAENKQEK